MKTDLTKLTNKQLLERYYKLEEDMQRELSGELELSYEKAFEEILQECHKRSIDPYPVGWVVDDFADIYDDEDDLF